MFGDDHGKATRNRAAFPIENQPGSWRRVTLLLLVFVIVPSGQRIGLAQPCAHPLMGVHSYPADYGPDFLAVGDLDGDLDTDWVVVNDFNIIVMLNNGSGAVASSQAYAVGGGPTSVTVGDLDGDLDLDLAVVNRPTESVSVLLNNGDGTFGTNYTSFNVGDGPFGVAIGDLDGDLDRDLAVSNYGSDNLSVLRNNGDGTFAPHVVFNTGPQPRHVAAGDLDGDQDLDLAVTNLFSGTVSVLLNVGDGTFGSAVGWGAGALPEFVALGDVDGDFDLDIAVANSNLPGPNVAVLLNNGDSTFQPHVPYDTTEGSPSSLAIFDLDQDSDLDLAVANRTLTVSLLLNNGDGTFASSILQETGQGPKSVASADLDADGDFDLIVANELGDDVAVMLNQGDGMFFAPSQFDSLREDLTLSDLNGDGHLDVIGLKFTTGNVSVRLGNGDGSFGALQVYDLGDDNGPRDVAVGDLNGDQIPDLAMAVDAGPQDHVALLLGNGDGTFIPDPQNYPCGDTPVALAVGDVDGDLDLDLMLAIHQGQLSVLHNTGDGTFTEPVFYGSHTGSNRDLAIGDLNGDSHIDAVLAQDINGSNDDFVKIFLGADNGIFVESEQFEAPIAPTSISLADANDDGFMDFVVAGFNGIGVLLNNGALTFAPPVLYDSGDDPVCVVTGHLNGDLTVDLAVASFGGMTTTVLLNHGDGTFAEPVFYGANGWDSVAVGDLNGDQVPDLVMGANDGIQVLPNLCATLVCIGDVDQNGVVGAADLALLLGAWGFSPGNPADVDNDTAVDGSDLAILLGNWGVCG